MPKRKVKPAEAYNVVLMDGARSGGQGVDFERRAGEGLRHEVADEGWGAREREEVTLPTRPDDRRSTRVKLCIAGGVAVMVVLVIGLVGGLKSR